MVSESNHAKKPARKSTPLGKPEWFALQNRAERHKHMSMHMYNVRTCLSGVGGNRIFLDDDGLRDADRRAFTAKLDELHVQIATDHGVEPPTAVSSLPSDTILSAKAEALLLQLQELRTVALAGRDSRWGTTGNPFWDCPWSSRYRG